MTITLNERIQAGGWNPNEAPPSGSPTGRFALTTNHSGNPSRPAATVANAYTKLVQERQASIPEHVPPLAEIALKFAGRKPDGSGWGLFDRGVVRGRVTLEPNRPTKYHKPSKLDAGDLVDELMMGGEAWGNHIDREIWAALLLQLKTLDASPREARAINDAVAIALCLRAGLIVHPGSLPTIGGLADEAEEA
jgi:hypothetical protein